MVYSKKQIKMENHSVVFEDVIFSNSVTVGDVGKLMKDIKSKYNLLRESSHLIIKNEVFM